MHPEVKLISNIRILFFLKKGHQIKLGFKLFASISILSSINTLILKKALRIVHTFYESADTLSTMISCLKTDDKATE